MAITKDSGRQYPLVAKVTFTGGTDVTAAASYAAIDIPAGARIISGSLNVTTAFTTNVDIDIGDGGDTDRYTPTIINADSTGITALVMTGYEYTVKDTIDVTIVTATAAAGVAELIIEYVLDNRANEVMPVQA